MVDDGTGVSRLAVVNSCPGFCGRQVITSSSGNVTYSSCQVCFILIQRMEISAFIPDVKYLLIYETDNNWISTVLI